MDSPPISVVIPAFNAGAFLPAAVQSVLNQSYGSFELLIIDDASSDVTPRIAQAFCSRDARVHYYRNPANLGVACSRNRGVALAQHSWIAFWTATTGGGRTSWRGRSHTCRSTLWTWSIPATTMDTAGRKIRSCFHVPESIAYPQLLRQNLISLLRNPGEKRWCQQFPMNPSVFFTRIFWTGFHAPPRAAAGGIDLPLHTVRIGRLRSKSGNKLRSAAANVQTYRFLGLFGPNSVLHALLSPPQPGQIRENLPGPRQSEGGPAL